MPKPVKQSSSDEEDETEQHETERSAPQTSQRSTHPKYEIMVNSAIKELGNRNGSSIRAINKYLAANYTLDIENSVRFVKRYIKGALFSGKLINSKGSGMAGSFKLSKEKSKVEPKLKPTKKKADSKSLVKPKLSAALAVKPPKTESKGVKKVTAKMPIKKTETAKNKDSKETEPKATKKSKKEEKTKEPKSKPVVLKINRKSFKKPIRISIGAARKSRREASKHEVKK